MCINFDVFPVFQNNSIELGINEVFDVSFYQQKVTGVATSYIKISYHNCVINTVNVPTDPGQTGHSGFGTASL